MVLGYELWTALDAVCEGDDVLLSAFDDNCAAPVKSGLVAGRRALQRARTVDLLSFVDQIVLALVF